MGIGTRFGEEYQLRTFKITMSPLICWCRAQPTLVVSMILSGSMHPGMESAALAVLGHVDEFVICQ